MPQPRKKKIKEIRANRIVLEDLEGNEKAVLDASWGNGLAFLSFKHKGRSLIDIGVEPNGNANITFYHKDGKVAMGLGTSADFGQGLTICDAEGRQVCFVFVDKDGIPRIRLFQVISPDEGKVFWATPDPSKA